MPAKKYFTEEEKKEGARLRRAITRPKRKERERQQAREWYAKNKNKIKKQRKTIRDKYPEREKGYQMKYRLNNAEKIKETKRKSRRKRNKQVVERNKAWRRSRPEHTRARRRAWAKKNPEKVLAYNANIRARRRERLHPDASKKKMAAIFKEARGLSVKTGISHHVDHIIPLSKKGWHHEDNIQTLPKHLNHNNEEIGGKGSDPFWLAPHAGVKDWRDVPRHLWPEKLAPEYERLIQENKGKSIRWDSAA